MNSRSLIIGYFSAVNVGSAGLFWYDKRQALNRGWRVRERDLCLSALVGGWIGGMVAMETFRHKTAKKSFQEKYYACMGANMLVLGVLGARFLPQRTRQQLLQSISNPRRLSRNGINRPGNRTKLN